MSKKAVHHDEKKGPPKLYTVYDPPGHPGESFEVLDEETGELVPEVSLTEQSHTADCDINTILKRYEDSGTPIDWDENPPYHDLSTLEDYKTSMDIVHRAQEAFEGLSAPIRARFKNDPAQLVHFMENPANREEAADLGLLRPEVAAAIKEARTAPPSPAVPPGGQGTPNASSKEPTPKKDAP